MTPAAVRTCGVGFALVFRIGPVEMWTVSCSSYCVESQSVALWHQVESVSSQSRERTKPQTLAMASAASTPYLTAPRGAPSLLVPPCDLELRVIRSGQNVILDGKCVRQETAPSHDRVDLLRVWIFEHQ